MINLTTLADKLQEKLNDNTAGCIFRVFPGTGKYLEAVATDNTLYETINCILSVVSNDMTVLNNGLIFATQTCNFSVIIPLEDTEENGGVTEITGFENGEPIETTTQAYEGNGAKIARIRSVLDNAFSVTTNESITEGESPAQKVYSVSTIYTLMDDGTRQVLPTIGYSYSMSSYIYYYFVENGISSRNNTVAIDGVILPYQSSSTYRTPTMDGYVPADTLNGTVENIASQSQASISLQLPVFSNDNAISDGLDYLLGGELNTAHIVILTVGNKTKTMLMTYGEITINADTVKNLGMTISLVPCATVYELVKIPSRYHIYVYTGQQATTINFGTSPYAFLFNNKQFAVKTTNTYSLTVSKNDIFMSLTAVSGVSNLTEIQ